MFCGERLDLGGIVRRNVYGANTEGIYTMTPRRMPPEKGRFKKGQSGNPAGRPRVSERDILEIMSVLLTLLIKAKNKDRAAQGKLLEIRELLRGLLNEK